MQNVLTQPTGNTAKEVNKQSIARDFKVKQSEVDYVTSTSALDNIKLIYNPTNEQVYYCTTVTGIVASYEVDSSNELILNTNDGTFTCTSAYSYDPLVSDLNNTSDVSLGDGMIGVKQPYTNAVVRTQHSKNSDTISVQDFGAVGDGTTDDTVAIQAAVSSGVGNILFPAGTYVVTATIKIPSNTSLNITPNATVIRGSGDCNSIFINDADGVTGGYLANENIRIYGGGTIDGNSTYSADSCTLISCGHMTNMTVEDLKIINVGGRWHAIEFNSSTFCVARRLYISTNGEPTDINGELIQIDNMENTGQFPWFGPYDKTCCDNIVIENCEFHEAGTGIGSHTVSTTDAHNNIIIRNNTFHTNCVAVKPIAWKNVLITGNRMIWGGNTGAIPTAAIYSVFQSSKIATGEFVISDNIISGWESANLTTDPVEQYRGIWIKGDQSDADPEYQENIVISGNIISTTSDHAIVVDYCTGAVISNNKVSAPNYTSTAKYSIYSWNSYQVMVSGNNVAGSIQVCGGTLTGQQASVCSNFVGGNLGRTLTDTPTVAWGNSVLGTNALYNYTDSMGATFQSDDAESRISLQGTNKDTIRLTSNSTSASTGNKGLYNVTSTRWLLRFDSSNVAYIGNNLLPQSNNSYSLGTASALYSSVYASTGTISTSDENYKTDIAELTDVEILVAKQCAKLIRTFKLKDGASQRTHVGTIAQLVGSTFTAAGLDPLLYGLYCYDKWDAQAAETDEDGNVTVEAVEAGERYAIRYDEFNAFVNAGLNAYIDNLNSRVEKLEKDYDSSLNESA